MNHSQNIITKCDGIITNCDSLVYYKVRWAVITNCDTFFITKCDIATGITKCDGFITNSDRYYKVRWLLQIATVQVFFRRFAVECTFMTKWSQIQWEIIFCLPVNTDHHDHDKQNLFALVLGKYTRYQVTHLLLKCRRHPKLSRNREHHNDTRSIRSRSQSSLPADVLWGSFVTHSFLPQNAWRTNSKGCLRGG